MTEPYFYSSTTYTPRDRSEIISVATGLQKLDKKIGGLNKKEITVLSGLRGSAKSTWLSQFALEAVNAGKKVALFSGELEESRVFDWLHLQAAGKNYTMPTQYENLYFVMPQVKPLIDQWMAQKLFVYNNNHGNKVDAIMHALENCMEQKAVDVIILDNLMSIDMGATSFNKNEKQTELIWLLKAFAKKNDVHIVLVAHPRKAIGFLRIEDISGTADLTNAADNVFIIHRVNNDFKRLSQLTFRWKQDNPVYEFNNVIEICKNRDMGYQDDMIGLYFQKEGKRLVCERVENKQYGWTALLPPTAR